MLTLADLFQAITNTRPFAAERTAISQVVIDSRQVMPGALFVALKGETLDGHAFISDALARGAVAVIAESRAQAGTGLGPNVHWIDTTQPSVAGLQLSPFPLVPIVFIAPSSLLALQQLAGFWRRKFECQVVGVTGSVGKSSTKELIAAVLRQHYRTLKSEGNLNNEIGLPLTVLQLNESHERAVLEMGMYALGEIKTLCEIAQPRIGVVTNVGPVHLERLGTLENIARAKAELIDALPDDGVAILNGDDVQVLAMKSRTRARVVSYGLNAQADVFAEAIVTHGLYGIEFTLYYGGEKFRVHSPLIGRHSVYTALAAIAVGWTEGLSWDEMALGLSDLSAQLRLRKIETPGGATILDDTYNSSPASALAALEVLAELRGRKIAVLGDMLELGAEELRGHQTVGARAAQIVDVLIVVGKRGKWIGEAARDAGLSEKEILFADNNAQAIELLRGMIRANDQILIKGSRGAKMEEIVSAITRMNEEKR
jgi:UDP-N-acetylmuramoyl-tripeptide--D-alanyl-D-alanine ligase